MDRYATLRTGLVGAWCPSLRNGGYTLEDRSNWRNNGTLINSPGWSAGALSLASANKQFVTLPNSALLGRLTGGPMTFTAWIRPNVVNAFTAFSGNASSAGSNATYVLEISRTTNKLTLIHFSDVVATSTTSLTARKWQLIGFARSGSSGAWTVRLITDGVIESFTALSNPSPTPTAPITIGRMGDFDGRYYDGLVDDVRIWNRPLSDSEIRLLATGRGVGLAPTRHRRASLAMQFWLNVSGAWKTAKPWINVGGTWKQGSPKIRVGGAWKG